MIFYLYFFFAWISDHIEYLVIVPIVWIVEVLIGHLIVRWYENGKKRNR